MGGENRCLGPRSSVGKFSETKQRGKHILGRLKGKGDKPQGGKHVPPKDARKLSGGIVNREEGGWGTLEASSRGPKDGVFPFNGTICERKRGGRSGEKESSGGGDPPEAPLDFKGQERD